MKKLWVAVALWAVMISAQAQDEGLVPCGGTTFPMPSSGTVTQEVLFRVPAGWDLATYPGVRVVLDTPNMTRTGGSCTGSGAQTTCQGYFPTGSDLQWNPTWSLNNPGIPGDYGVTGNAYRCQDEFGGLVCDTAPTQSNCLFYYRHGRRTGITKTGPSSAVDPGADVTFTLNVSNADPRPEFTTTSLVVSDLVPAFANYGLTLGTPVSVDFSCTTSGQQVTCTRSSLAGTASSTITINATAYNSTSSPQTVNNCATVSYNELVWPGGNGEPAPTTTNCAAVVIRGTPDDVSLGVNSSGASAVSITGISSGAHGGTTNYTRTIADGTTVTLNAPYRTGTAPNERVFSSWSGCNSVGGAENRTCNIVMAGGRTVTANYQSADLVAVSWGGNAPGGTVGDTDRSVYFEGRNDGPARAYSTRAIITTTVGGVAPRPTDNWNCSNVAGGGFPAAQRLVCNRGNTNNGAAIQTWFSQVLSEAGSGQLCATVESDIHDPNASNNTICRAFTISAPSSTLSVNSTGTSGVSIASITGHGGTTNYTQTIAGGANVTLTAPYRTGTAPNEYVFSSWSGCDSVGGTGNRTCDLVMDGNRTATANYQPADLVAVSWGGNAPGGTVGDTDRSVYFEGRNDGPARAYSTRAIITTTVGGVAPRPTDNWNCSNVAGGGFPAAQRLVCNRGNPNSGATISTWFSQVLSDAGSGQLCATLESDIHDPNATNNTICQNFTISAQMRTLAVNSAGTSGVIITSGTGHGGTTNYTRSIADGTDVELTAPYRTGTAPNEYVFANWTGCDYVDGAQNRVCHAAMGANRTVTANYQPADLAAIGFVGEIGGVTGSQSGDLNVRGRNDGPAPAFATRVTITTTLGALLLTSPNSSNCSTSGPQTLICSRGTQANGATFDTFFRLDRTVTGAGELCATFSSDIHDPVSGNNQTCTNFGIGQEVRNLNVNSTGTSGVAITSSIAAYGGTTNYNRQVEEADDFDLTAPQFTGATPNRYVFAGWTGCNSVGGTQNRTCSVQIAGDRTVTVDYQDADLEALGFVGEIGGVTGSQSESLNARGRNGGPAQAFGTSVTITTTLGELVPTSPNNSNCTNSDAQTLVCTRGNPATETTFNTYFHLNRTNTGSGELCATFGSSIHDPNSGNNQTCSSFAIAQDIRTLNVNSTGTSGVAITSSVAAYGGTTNYSRQIEEGEEFSLTAPRRTGAAPNEYVAGSWTNCNSVGGSQNRTCNVVMAEDRTVTISYHYAELEALYIDGEIDGEPSTQSALLTAGGINNGPAISFDTIVTITTTRGALIPQSPDSTNCSNSGPQTLVCDRGARGYLSGAIARFHLDRTEAGPGQICATFSSAIHDPISGNNQICRSFTIAEAQRTITVNATGAADVPIAGAPGELSGTTSYQRDVTDGSAIQLTAPATHSGWGFASWGGCDVTSNGGRTCSATANADRTFTANYEAADLRVTDVDMPAQAIVEEVVDGVVNWGNWGPSRAAAPTTLVIQTSLGQLTTASSAGGTCLSLSPNTISCEHGAIFPDDTNRGTRFQFLAPAGFFGQAEVCAEVSSSTFDPAPNNNEACRTITVLGEQRTITVQSVGASGVPITANNSAHAGTTNYDFQARQGQIVTLNAPESHDGTVFAAWAQCPVIAGDGDRGCQIEVENDEVVIARYGLADLQAVNIQGPETVSVGTEVAYTGAIRNNGPNEPGVFVVEASTTRGTIVAVSSPGAIECHYSGQRAQCRLANLGVGGGATMDWSIDMPATDGEVTICLSVVPGSVTDPDMSNNQICRVVQATTPPTRTMQVLSVGASAVEIVSRTSPTHAGITDYSRSVTTGADVWLTAPLTPTGSTTFSHWEGCGPLSSENLCVAKADLDLVLTAHYTTVDWSLRVSSEGAQNIAIVASVEAYGGITDYARDVPDGMGFTLFAPRTAGTEPDSPVFHSWSGSCDVITGTYLNACTIDMASDKAVTANYVPAAASADLRVSKTGNNTVYAAEAATFTVLLRNDGPDNATGVQVIDTLPAGTIFSSAGGPGWSCSHSGNEVQCLRPTPLGAGSAADPLRITVLAPPEPGVIVNTASAFANEDDPNPASATDTHEIEVLPSADLAIAKTGPASVTSGGEIRYRVSVMNFGPSASTAMTVETGVPSNTTFRTATGAGWGCAESSGTILCSRSSNLAVGVRTPEISLVFDVNTLPAQTGLVSCSDVDSSIRDPNTGNNNACHSVTGNPDVGIGPCN